MRAFTGSGGMCNFYLIEQSGKFTLVDAGAPGDWAFFGQALAALAVTADRMRATRRRGGSSISG